MPDFLQNIQTFEQNGNYTYVFDDVGNLTFNSSSNTFTQVYLSLPLSSSIYNDSKIQSFYDVNFEEFIPTTLASSSAATASSMDSLQQQLGATQQQNMSLQSQLTSLTTLNQVNTSASTTLATQQVIVELRIALGQGQVASDFSSTFPYTPLVQTAITSSLS